MSVLLDTHIWVWWLTPGSPLSRAERDALDTIAGHRQLYLPAISLWEAQVLHAKRRLELPLPFDEWLSRATDERMISIVPLSGVSSPIRWRSMVDLPQPLPPKMAKMSPRSTSKVALCWRMLSSQPMVTSFT